MCAVDPTLDVSFEIYDVYELYFGVNPDYIDVGYKKEDGQENDGEDVSTVEEAIEWINDNTNGLYFDERCPECGDYEIDCYCE